MCFIFGFHHDNMVSQACCICQLLLNLVFAGVDDITAVVIILLEGNPKDKSWGAAQKLMNNVDKFLERLRGYKGIIDQGQVRSSQPPDLQQSSVADNDICALCDSYLVTHTHPLVLMLPLHACCCVCVC